MRKSPQKSAYFDSRLLAAFVLFSSALFFAVLSFAGTSPGQAKIAPSTHNVVAKRNLALPKNPTPASKSGPGWSIVNSPDTTEQQLGSVSCISKADCWAAGYYTNTEAIGRTLVEHWDGSSWSIVPSPNATSNNLIEDNRFGGITCSSTSDCWAVGRAVGAQYTTLIEHWDGMSWSIVNSPNPSSARNELYDVVCTSGSDCFAVGYYKTGFQNRLTQTLIELWDGSSWSVVSSANTASSENVLVGLKCNSSTDCWSVGYSENSSGYFQALTEHWDGNTWAIVTSSSTSTTKHNYLQSVTCNSNTDCWAVGYYDTGAYDANDNEIYQALIEHWDGVGWSIVSSQNPLQTSVLYGVTCISSSQCWAMGDASDSSSQVALIEQWDGNAWTTVPAPTGGSAQFNSLFAVACTSSSECWSVGGSEGQFTLTEKWDGTAWSIVASPNAAGGGVNNHLNSVSCSSASNCWSVGENDFGDSFIQHWNGNLWSRFYVPFGPTLYSYSLSDLTCVSGANCWAVGSAYDGNSEQTVVKHWDGSSWSEVASPNSSGNQDSYLSGITCASASDCWAVGDSYLYSSQAEQTLIEHWDGNSWSIVPSPNGSSTGSGSVNQLSGVSCTSSSDCWAVGVSGSNNTYTEQPLTEHWDGSSWTIVASSAPGQQNFVYRVACTSSSDCWAVGYSYTPDGPNQALIEHWDGNLWQVVPAPTDPTNDDATLRDVTCASATNCWAVGIVNSETLTLHWDGSAWSVVPSADNVGSNELFAVTCPSSAQCWAVGEHQIDPNDNPPLFPFQTLIEEYSLTIPPLTSVGSRLTHGGATTFDVDLPLTGNPGIECRNANGNYSVVFSFVNNVSDCGSAATTGGSVAPGPNPNQCTENLTGITNGQHITIELDNVIDAENNTGNVATTMGVLIGDTTGDGFVNSGDISQTKSQSGNAVTISNFREDINLDGFINSADISLVKAHSGTALSSTSSSPVASPTATPAAAPPSNKKPVSPTSKPPNSVLNRDQTR